MSSSEAISKSRGFLYLINLLFGGIFIGIAVMMASMHFYTGWPDTVLPLVGGVLIAIPYRGRPKRTFIGVYILGAFAIGFAQLAGRGLAILAAGGAYGSYKFMGPYFDTQNDLLVGILWLLFGVPLRAFKYQLDQSGKGNVQRIILNVITIAVSILTGGFILLLHFGGGPLHQVAGVTLTVGIIFTILVIAPVYRLIAKACWQRGIRSAFSPKPLIRRWSDLLAELDTAFHQPSKQRRASSGRGSVSGKDVQTSSDSLMYGSGVKSIDAASPSRPSPPRSPKQGQAAVNSRRNAKGQRSSGAALSARNSPQRRKKS